MNDVTMTSTEEERPAAVPSGEQAAPGAAAAALTVSIVIPVFNEANTLEATVGRVLAADSLGTAKEIILVDDGSVDGSADLAKNIAAREPAVRAFAHAANRGKGAALRTGFEHARGDIVLIQDADMEYNPTDYPKLLGPILDGRADIVYGSRFRGGGEGNVTTFARFA